MALVRMYLVFAAAVALLAFPSLASADVGEFTERTVTVTTTATRIDSTTATIARSIVVCVDAEASGSVRVGSSGVTATKGPKVDPGKCYSPGERLSKGGKLYAITISGSVDVQVQEGT